MADYPKDPGGKATENKILSPLVGWTRRTWEHRELMIGHSRSKIGGATRHRIAGTVILLIGCLTLIELINTSHRFEVVMAAVSLFLGNVMIIKAFVEKGAEKDSFNLLQTWLRIASYTSTPMTSTANDKMREVIFIGTLADGVFDSQTELAEFEAKPFIKEFAVTRQMLNLSNAQLGNYGKKIKEH